MTEEYYKDQFTAADEDNIKQFMRLTSTLHRDEVFHLYKWVKNNDSELYADMLMYKFFMEKNRELNDE